MGSEQSLLIFYKGGVPMLDDLAPVIANLGFPIVVALYLLMRVEKKLDELGSSMAEIVKAISKLL